MGVQLERRDVQRPTLCRATTAGVQGSHIQVAVAVDKGQDALLGAKTVLVEVHGGDLRSTVVQLADRAAGAGIQNLDVLRIDRVNHHQGIRGERDQVTGKILGTQALKLGGAENAALEGHNLDAADLIERQEVAAANVHEVWGRADLKDNRGVEVLQAVDEALCCGGDHKVIKPESDLHHAVARELQVLNGLVGDVLDANLARLNQRHFGVFPFKAAVYHLGKDDRAVAARTGKLRAIRSPGQVQH
mmetsp:Transcript_17524/g.30508  ORF Transcript_17524/g.30508 Transcript_17524/m.30508 type:complete len:246 (-) Transcript_17524:830-1567(-)